MPVFSIELPDKRVLDIEAGDQETAMRGAQEWHASNPMTAGGTAMDMAKSAGTGLLKGSLGMLGAPADIGQTLQDAAGSFAGSIAPHVGADPETAKKTVIALMRSHPLFAAAMSGPKSADLQKGVEGMTGPLYSPKTTAGQYAQSVGEFAPAVIGGPGGIVRRAIGAVGAGLGSEAAGQATQGTEAEPWARMGGALAGGLAPSALSRVVTPLPVNAEHAAAVRTLRNEGVTDLTAGQTTNRQGLKYFESENGGGRAAALGEGSGEQFTRAALRRIGEDAPRATPEVMDRAFTRIGQTFDDLAARNPVTLDRTLGNELVRVEQQYHSMTPETFRAPVIAGVIRDIGNTAAQTGGVLSGEAYGALRSRLEQLARGSSDNQLVDAFRGIKGALDDAMARSMTSSADRAALREARRQYRNIIVIEKAATGAGQAAAEGIISPSALRNATKQQSTRAYARGQGDFAELARAGEAVMKPLPNSGTAPRLAARGIGSMLGAGAGALLGSAAGAPNIGAMAGAAAGVAAPRVAARGLLSSPARAYLGNQVMNEQPGLFSQQALQEAMLRLMLSQPGGGGMLALPSQQPK